MPESRHQAFILRAIELAREASIERKIGGPFGSVIVRDGEIVGEGYNSVLEQRDPTSHGEIVAIRDACKNLDTHDLSGCTLYTSSEPCPMCYGAIWWARITKVYYASTIEDALHYGEFDDKAIYESMNKEPHARGVPCIRHLHNEMSKLWKEFKSLSGRAKY